MKRKTSPLKLGRESYGTADIKQTFVNAFAPYFVNVEKETSTKSVLLKPEEKNLAFVVNG